MTALNNIQDVIDYCKPSSVPTNPDEYEGWTNRETWAVSLHISNDPGTYLYASDLCETAKEEAEGDQRLHTYYLADAFHGLG